MCIVSSIYFGHATDILYLQILSREYGAIDWYNRTFTYLLDTNIPSYPCKQTQFSISTYVYGTLDNDIPSYPGQINFYLYTRQ